MVQSWQRTQLDGCQSQGSHCHRLDDFLEHTLLSLFLSFTCPILPFFDSTFIFAISHYIDHYALPLSIDCSGFNKKEKGEEERQDCNPTSESLEIFCLLYIHTYQKKEIDFFLGFVGRILVDYTCGPTRNVVLLGCQQLFCILLVLSSLVSCNLKVSSLINKN